jgi:ubiquinone/menaquinone biosynthesis C-methylase UbiE
MASWHKKRDVMHRYDATANMYDARYAEEQAAKIEAALKNVEIKERDLILDVGCGTGILFGYVAEKTKTAIVGLDISKKSLLRARERAKNLANVHLILADADNMPFKSNVFDSVFAMTVIQNTPDPRCTLRETKRVATDDAAIVVTGLKKIFTKKTFEQLLRNAGLKIAAFQGEGLKCNVAICTKLLPSRSSGGSE